MLGITCYHCPTDSYISMYAQALCCLSLVGFQTISSVLLLKNKHISNPALVPILRSMGGKTPSKLGLREKLFLITGPLTTFLFYITQEITSTEVVYSLKIYLLPYFSFGPYIKCCSIIPGPPIP